jgi:hypothetical protein
MNNAFRLNNILYQTTEEDEGNAKNTFFEKVVKGYGESETEGKQANITLCSTMPVGNNKETQVLRITNLLKYHHR